MISANGGLPAHRYTPSDPKMATGVRTGFSRNVPHHESGHTSQGSRHSMPVLMSVACPSRPPCLFTPFGRICVTSRPSTASSSRNYSACSALSFGRPANWLGRVRPKVSPSCHTRRLAIFNKHKQSRGKSGDTHHHVVGTSKSFLFARHGQFRRFFMPKQVWRQGSASQRAPSSLFAVTSPAQGSSSGS